MLMAGGLSVLSDGTRQADEDNPRGYLEWERIKRLPKDPACIAEAENKVVKVISQLLFSIPATHNYRIIFMQRPLSEVLKSQDEMLLNRGNYDEAADRAKIEEAFTRHLAEVNTWLDGTGNIEVLRVNYHHIVREPRHAAEAVAAFLKAQLDIAAMARQVYSGLYRNRITETLTGKTNLTQLH
jgi:hypothetical protein